ncbi:hypothetical protein BLNAU_10596 [Blattamonas nauphoetae]|uniref:Uncharacterized protein n=1 Tax=Blattamonas nauphoetae TaxID=2049346 RepID=A0ABQ9XPV7_9EUKA|nr:hypothetical protein BLNAU_10596 [Blattamonas nauphoetae]
MCNCGNEDRTVLVLPSDSVALGSSAIVEDIIIHLTQQTPENTYEWITRLLSHLEATPQDIRVVCSWTELPRISELVNMISDINHLNSILDLIQLLVMKGGALAEPLSRYSFVKPLLGLFSPALNRTSAVKVWEIFGKLMSLFPDMEDLSKIVEKLDETLVFLRNHAVSSRTDDFGFVELRFGDHEGVLVASLAAFRCLIHNPRFRDSLRFLDLLIPFVLCTAFESFVGVLDSIMELGGKEKTLNNHLLEMEIVRNGRTKQESAWPVIDVLLLRIVLIESEGDFQKVVGSHMNRFKAQISMNWQESSLRLLKRGEIAGHSLEGRILGVVSSCLSGMSVSTNRVFSLSMASLDSLLGPGSRDRSYFSFLSELVLLHEEGITRQIVRLLSSLSESLVIRRGIVCSGLIRQICADILTFSADLDHTDFLRVVLSCVNIRLLATNKEDFSEEIVVDAVCGNVIEPITPVVQQLVVRDLKERPTAEFALESLLAELEWLSLRYERVFGLTQELPLASFVVGVLQNETQNHRSFSFLSFLDESLKMMATRPRQRHWGEWRRKLESEGLANVLDSHASSGKKGYYSPSRRAVKVVNRMGGNLG